MQTNTAWTIVKNLLAILVIIASAFAAVAGAAKLNAAAAQAPGIAEAGLPELAIVKTNNGFVAPDTVPAGRYVVRLQNLTDYPAVADLMLLPAGKDIEEVQAVYGAGMQSAIQAWFGSIAFAGGPSAPAHGEGRTVVDLGAGRWTVATLGAGSGSPAATIAVIPSTGTLPALDESATIAVGNGALELPGAISPGEQLWRIENAGTAPLAIELVKVAGPSGAGEGSAVLGVDSPVGADETQGGIVLGGTGILSPGRTVWLRVAIEPGTYVVRWSPASPASDSSTAPNAVAIVAVA